MQKLIVLAVVALLGACSPGHPTGAAGEAVTETREVRQSQVRAGGSIPVRTRLLSKPALERPVTVELVIAGGAPRGFWLQIADNDHYRVAGDYRRVLASGDGGPVVEQIIVTPLTPGKHYLRMTVSEAGGDNPTSVVVALRVDDPDGAPSGERESRPRERIEFRSAPLDTGS